LKIEDILEVAMAFEMMKGNQSMFGQNITASPDGLVSTKICQLSSFSEQIFKPIVAKMEVCEFETK
jgi:hypothetical protein